jgi:Integrase core domain
VDAWRHEYNHDRPHQSLDMATPASRFRPRPPEADDGLSLWAPADLEPLASPPAEPDHAATAAEPASWPGAVEVDRIVPPSGNMTVGPQQFWLGTARAGQKVTVWIDTTTCHLSVGGWRIKTVPSRLSEVDLARLRRTDGRPAGPPPAGPSPGVLAASRCVEVDRLATGTGGVTLLNRLILVGSPLAGQRARIRLDGQLMHVITQDGVLWRTLPCPIPPGQRHRLQGVRLAGPAPLPEPAPAVQRRVSSRGGI